MDEESRRLIAEFYSNLYHKYGDSVASLAYKSPDLQKMRFAMMAQVQPISRESSVLDVGCGLGHFCKFLRSFGWEGKYTGVDIEPDLIKAAKENLPGDDFFCLDILVDDFNEFIDHVFCGATIQQKPKNCEGYQYMMQMVKKMFSLANKTLVFDVFSGNVDYKNDNNLYVDPDKLIKFCYSLTKRIVLRNDARPYEIMAYLYKNEDKDDYNVYSSWIASMPTIV